MNHRVQKFLSNPKKALYSLAWPIMVGMLVQVLYNIVDTAWVGRLGAEAIAAVTFSFPVFFMLMSINSGIATGANSLISRLLGAGKHEEAENTVMHSFLMSIGLAIVVAATFFPLMKPLFALSGADGNVLTMALSYIRIVLMGVVFMFPVFLINNIFIAQGDTKTPVIIQVIALLINVVLDPIFIFTLGMGVSGAALATSLTFVIALMMSLYALHTRSELKLSWKSFKWNPRIVWDILKVGAPAGLLMLMMSVYIMFLNSFMAHYSTEHVAAFGIASRLEAFATLPIVAFSFSLLTLVGMFYGAKRYDVMESTAWYGIRTAAMITGAVGLVLFIFPEPFFRIFTPDKAIIDIGSQYMRVDVFTFPLMAIGMSISRAMQGIGKGMPGLVVNMTRIYIVAVPLAYVFVYVMDKPFIWVAYAMVAGGIAANMIAIPWLRHEFKEIRRTRGKSGIQAQQ
jgi:putative MATE family efflux protein